MRSFFATFRLILAVLVLGIGSASAATVTWSASSDGLWSNGSNWSTSSVPGSSDDVIFDGTSNHACTIDVAASISSLTISSAYTGAITESASLSTSGDISISGSAYGAGSQTISCGGNFSIANTANLFSAGTSTVSLTGTGNLSNPQLSNAFYYINVAASGQITSLTADIYVTKQITVTAGGLHLYSSGTGNSLHLRGSGQILNIGTGYIDGNFGLGGGQVIFEANTTSSLHVEGINYGGSQIGLSVIGAITGTFDMQGSIEDVDSLYTTADTSGGVAQWNCNNYNVSLNSNLAVDNWGGSAGTTIVNAGSGIFNIPSFCWFAGNDTLNLGSSTWNCSFGWGVWGSSAVVNVGTSLVNILGGDVGASWMGGPESFYDLTFDSGGSDNLYQTVTVNDSLTVSTGTVVANGNNVTVDKDISVSSGGALDAGTSNINLAGSGSQNLAFGASDSLGTINISGGTRTLSFPDGFTADNFISAAGTTLIFGAGQTYDIANLTLNGLTSAQIRVESSVPLSAWNLNVSTSQAVAEINVSDTNAAGGITIDATDVSVNSGDNTNILFSPDLPSLGDSTLQYCHNQDKGCWYGTCPDTINCPVSTTSPTSTNDTTNGNTGGGGPVTDITSISGGASGGGSPFTMGDSVGGGSASFAKGDSPQREVYTPIRSFVDTLGFNYYHLANDYHSDEPGPSSGGCSTCGRSPVSTEMGALERLAITRIHRYRDFWITSSLGQGVFFDELDMKLQLIPVGLGGNPQMWIFDPRELDHYHSIFDSGVGGDTTIDGIYHDAFSQMVDVRLYDSTGTLTPNQSLAVTAVLTRLNGETYTFEIIDTSTDTGNTERDARLIYHKDRNGNALTISYVYAASASNATLSYDRTQLWKINTVTDPHGAVATFTYGSSIVNYHWVVTRIDLPNSQHLSYTYGVDGFGGGWVGGTFRTATHPDGTVSTVSTSYDTGTQNLIVNIADNAATDGSVNENVYMSIGYYVASGGVINQPASLVRQIYNGSGEIIYRNYEEIHDPNTTYAYHGAGKLTREQTTGIVFHQAHSDATSAYTPGSTRPSSSTGWDVTHQYLTASTGMITQDTDALGRVWDYTVDASKWVATEITYPDATTDYFTYNAFRQITQHIDRVSRESDFAYDSHGNMTSELWAVGTADAATWSWTYNSRGQPLTATDANGNVHSYTYDSNGYLFTITEPEDFTGGTEAVWTFTHSSGGLLDSMTDPEGRETDYAYDSRNRLTTTTYADSSTEVFGYGSSGTANLITSWTDRNGHITAFNYDASGRTTSTVWAQGLPESVSRSCVYLVGTHKVTSCVVCGNKWEYTYDQRLRSVSMTAQPNTVTNLPANYSYDVMDRRVKTTDPYGRSIFTVFDVNDRPTRVVQELAPGGLGSTNPSLALRITSPNPAFIINDTTFDAVGEVTASLDGRAIQTTYSFDHQGRIADKVMAAGTADAGETQFDYDAQSNCLEMRWPRNFTESGGFKTDFTYTKRNLLASRTEAVGRPEEATTNYTYTPEKNKASETNGRGYTTNFIYCTCCNRLEEVIDPLSYITSYAYDFYGNVISTTDPNSNVISNSFDGLNRLSTMTNGAGETTVYSYDDNLTDGIGIDSSYASYIPGLNLGLGSVGAAVKTTDPAGNSFIRIVDGIGRTIRVIDGNGNATTTTYDAIVSGISGAAGPLIEVSVIDPLGNTNSSAIDGRGLAEANVDALGKISTNGFDANGNRVISRDPNMVGYNCTYDFRDRKTVFTDTHGVSNSSGYDAEGNTISANDGFGHSTTWMFNGRNQQLELTDRISGSTSYTYDQNCNVLSITDAQSGVTSYNYDQRDLMTSESFPGIAGGTRHYTYDPGKRMITRTDQASIVTAYLYDGANRLTTREYPDGKNDSFGYDLASRLTSATSGRYSNTVNRSYDFASRLIEESLTVVASPEQATTTRYDLFYGYDNANRLSLLSYPDGKQVVRTYTNRNQLSSVTYDSSTVAVRTYDDGMRLSTTSFGNSLVETRAYRNDIAGKDNLLASISIPGVTNFTYIYDSNKRVTSETDGIVSGQTQSMNYDNLDRLNSWNRSSGDTQSWSLSLVGDWNSTTINGTLQSRTHNSTHEITAINTTPLSYDSKGNLILDGSAVQSYSWDVENRLSSASGTGMSAYYRYDALGRRTQKTVNQLTTTYVSAGAQEIYEVDTNQSVYYSLAANGGPGTSSLPVGGVMSGADITRVNFQPSIAAVPTGFVADTGAEFGLQSSGAYYGWEGGSQSYTAERNVLPLENFDTLNEMQHSGTANGIWQYALPDGDYPVIVVMGDASSMDMVNDITIEGESFIDPDPFDPTYDYGYQLGKFDGYATVAHVTGGILTIAPDTEASHAKICFIEIGEEGGSIDATTTDRLNELIQKMNEATEAIPKKINIRKSIYGDYVDEPLLLVNGLTKSYLHSNHAYSISVATDSTGNVIEKYGYDSYGKRSVFSPSGLPLTGTTIHDEWGFTGRRHDEETGLIYFRSRAYDPSLGRFLNRMPWWSTSSSTSPLSGANYNGNYSIGLIPEPFRSSMIDSMQNGHGNYLDNRFNLYIGQMDDPINRVEPFSGPWCVGLGLTALGVTGISAIYWWLSPSESQKAEKNLKALGVDASLSKKNLDINVHKCEIVLYIGHGFKKNPVKFHFPDGGCAGAGFLGCWPGDVNTNIPDANKIPGMPDSWPEPGNYDSYGNPVPADDQRIANGFPGGLFATAQDAGIENAKDMMKKLCKCCPIITLHIFVSKDIIDQNSLDNKGNWTYDCASGTLGR